RGARHITFGDPDFLNGPGHGMAIVRQLHRRWPELTFDITAQIRHLDRHRRYLSELAELGCAFVISAVESLSDTVLARLRKGHRRDDFVRVLDLCRAAGLVLRPTFVTFTPWTTLDDVRQLSDFIADHDLVDHVDPIQLAIRLLVPPGSLLLDAPDTAPYFGPLDRAALTHVWTHPDPRVDRLQRDLAACVARVAQSGATGNDSDSRDERAGNGADAVFAEQRRLIYAATDLAPPPPLPARAMRPVPRMTEPWFC
ncbi:MAG: radical SAM protein, partial [Myxococcota bacterium]